MSEDLKVEILLRMLASTEQREVNYTNGGDINPMCIQISTYQGKEREEIKVKLLSIMGL